MNKQSRQERIRFLVAERRVRSVRNELLEVLGEDRFSRIMQSSLLLVPPESNNITQSIRDGYHSAYDKKSLLVRGGLTREEAIAELIALPQFLKGCQLAFSRSFDIGVLSIGTQLESQFLEAMCDFDQQGLCFGVDGVFVAMLDFCWDGDEWNPQTAEFELSIIK